MTSGCEELHASLERLPRLRYSFADFAMPENGIHFFYEEGEAWGHGGDAPRTVRVGTHRDGNFHHIGCRQGSGTFRVIYTARMENAIYVLNAFQKNGGDAGSPWRG